MEIKLKHEIAFDIQESILTATLKNANEIIMLMSSGEVINYNIAERNYQSLFSVKSNIGYPGGGFDLNAKSTIYILENIVVIVNNFKRHGFVHYPEKYNALHLWREDYHADISNYPIALFKNKENVPHIIYGVAWNHLQIMNLDTCQVLTAAKSLIEENAEERHIEYNKKYDQTSNQPWPRTYDYFFGELLLSPNKTIFLSAGWVWGSSDAYKVYDIQKFINSNRISAINIDFWEHENRAVCWIDNETIAVTYNPFTEDDENSTGDSYIEIHFYKLDKEKTEIIKKTQIDQNIVNVVNSKFNFNKSINSFISFSNEIGLAIISLEGNIVLQNKNLKIDGYNSDLNLLLTIDTNMIVIYEIEV